MKQIRRIIVILTNRTERYYGFRFIRCSDGGTVAAQVSGNDSNIRFALANTGAGWLDDYFCITEIVKEKELFGLPHAGSSPDAIREYVALNLPALPSDDSRLPDKERVAKGVRAPTAKNTCLNVPIYGHRDPRGPDNNLRVWVDARDRLHVRLEKTNRCYQFAECLDGPGHIEIIAT